VGVIKWNRLVGEGPRTRWRDARSGQTTTLAGGPATSLREHEGERGLGVPEWRHRERRLWAVRAPGSPRCARIRWMTGGHRLWAINSMRSAQWKECLWPHYTGS